ncbi:hypothetical protein Emin_0942 [Elusimicrobium minutum Pei191]|uniref:Uncharacterized protein n=1 Tax=Elusimicrobium minutum (strain Pei191) TaxID=445932 RepID=B2KD99_ELUMP|nr:hypothetical protein [Elusimicrobium minutum]ACC98495.1 hypothetical protein Emin_0942 [Elusimicrobium minutum Pei191]
MSECIFSGIKFFGRNNANLYFGGTATASSASDDAAEACNGDFNTGWQSEGEGTDGTQVFWERNFPDGMSGDTIYLANHNIADIQLSLNGAAAIPPSKTVRADDNAYSLFSFPYREDITDIKITGSKTFVVNNEKQIGEVLLLETVGQFEEPQELTPTRNRGTEDLKLQNEKSFVYNGGEAWSFTLDIFSLSQIDIDLLELIQRIGTEMYIWPCGGNENQFLLKRRPNRFQDLIKVSIVGNSNPRFKENNYNSGLRDSIKFKEVE